MPAGPLPPFTLDPELVLQGQHVRLEPLSPSHHADLCQAVQDGELWRLWYTSIPHPEQMQAEIARRIGLREAKTWLPFAVCSAGKAIGMTSYLNIDANNRRLEIGSTWYRQSAQRTAINSESKLLLLRHAFESQAALAVEFRTHHANTRSQQAIEALGAKLDGVLRHHMWVSHPAAPSPYRNTHVYSILAEEWPQIQTRLQQRLARAR